MYDKQYGRKGASVRGDFCQGALVRGAYVRGLMSYTHPALLAWLSVNVLSRIFSQPQLNKGTIRVSVQAFMTCFYRLTLSGIGFRLSVNNYT